MRHLAADRVVSISDVKDVFRELAESIRAEVRQEISSALQR